MRITSTYPVLMTADVFGTAAFWSRHFDLQPAFESDWYVHLTRQGFDIAVLDRDHATIPAEGRGRTADGILVNLEVEDVDSAYRRAVADGLSILLPLRDDAFGQRHFITRDPNGVLIDVITPIPPDAAFSGAYSPEARPA